MKSLWQDSTRQELHERLMRLGRESVPRWGTMTAPRMVVHLVDSFRSANGELPVVPRKLPVRFSPLKELIIYVLPFPKNAPTATELVAREPGKWDADIRDLAAAMDTFAHKGPTSSWPEHPAFGHLSGRQWGILMYSHADHHFRQFGA
jgi:hypothetical protein